MNASVCTEYESLEVLDFQKVEKPAARDNETAEAFTELARGVQATLESYSNVHRGSGHNSLVSTYLYEQARDIVLEFLGLEIFGQGGGQRHIGDTIYFQDTTRYPLQGAHASVECGKCHKSGKSFKGLRFQACTECHSDFHQGQFASRASKGACEECHSVAGFSPSKFTLEEHQTSKYILAGSHLAVPCNSCHAKELSGGNNQFFRFKFESTRCPVCHKNPHKESVDTYVAKGGCEYCHLVDSWQASGFNHAGTKFALEGKHKDVKCRQCHQKGTGEDAQLQFSGLSMACQGCHEDIHRAQFAAVKTVSSQATNETECARCHSPAAWKTIKFDHNRDSAFKLDGAHVRIACVQCHKPVMDGTKEFVKYKPLGTTCSACHDANFNKGGAGKS